MSAIHLSVEQVALSLALVATAVAISIATRSAVERDIGVAVARSAIQLSVMGFVIQAIFDSDSLWLVAALVAVQVMFGAFTSRARARKVPHALGPLLLALAVAAAATLGLVVALGVFDATPRALVPVGGMVVGNAMTAAAVALARLGDEVEDHARRIEATLALGATGADAIRPSIRRALRSGLTPLIDQTKTTGLVAFPGTMVGMLLAGAAPADAVRLQLVLLYTLLGGAAIATLVAVLLGSRAFFTRAHQLREREWPPQRPRPAGASTARRGFSRPG